MPDYPFENLSPRTFEHLVQALALKYLGGRVNIFGDGPDGGREATFNGRVSYPSTTAPWEGYGVLQAKFKQRKAEPIENAQWLGELLRREMRRFEETLQSSEDPRSSPPIPEYYLLATNVILSPGSGQGKDRIHYTLQEYQRRFKWKEFDLWDADKISRMLDDSPEIRVTYAGWLLAGDVLNAVMDQIGLTRADPTTMTLFMQKDLLAAQYASLRQAGHVDDQRVPLSRLFVDLPISAEQRFEPAMTREEQKEVPLFLRVLFQLGDAHRDDSTHEHDELPGSASPVRERRRGQLVLLGGPGQGKTTLGQYACQIYRAALLRQSSVRLSNEAQDALATLEEQAARMISALKCRRFPVHVDLNDLARYLERAEIERAPSFEEAATSLLAYIRARINQRTSRQLSLEDLRRWFTSYPWFVFLDGLDEIAASQNRKNVVQCIADFSLEIQVLNADVMTLVTCRPQSYTQEFDRRYYEHRWLAPLSDEQALDYGRRLSRSRHTEGSADRESAEKLLEACIQHASTARLMRSPLQVTIMAALVERLGRPPERRWNLFSEYYRVIYEREMSRETSWSGALRQHRSDVDAIHRRVGFVLQQRGEGQSPGEATLSLEEFRSIVRSRLEYLGYKGTELDQLTGVLCEAVNDRLVFLAGLAVGRVGFELRSLQEFMASDYLLDAPEASSKTHGEEVQRNLQHIVQSAYWRNVALFAVDRIYSRDQYNREYIEAQCQRMNELVEDGASSATSSGSRLALEILEDGSATHQPNSVRVLARLSLRLLRCASEEIVARLALQYGPFTETIFYEELQRSLDSSLYSETRSAIRLTCKLAQRGSGWALRTLETFASASKNRPHLLVESFRGLAGDDIPVRILAGHATRLSYDDYLEIGVFNENERVRFEYPFAEAVVRWRLACHERMRGAYDGDTVVHYIPSDGSISGLGYGYQSIELDAKTFAHLNDVGDNGDLHVDWRAMLANIRFARTPSKEMLAAILEEIGAAALGSGARRIKLCWPVELCLQACASAEELRVLISKARNGELGDGTHWLSLEKRWCAQGVREGDFLSESSVANPFDRLRPDAGFPFEIAQPIVNEPVDSNTVYALNVLRLRALGNARHYIANLLGRLTGYLDLDSTADVLELYETIAVDDVQLDPNVFLGLLRALRPTGELNTSLCDAVGRRAFRSVQRALGPSESLRRKSVASAPRGEATQTLLHPVLDKLTRTFVGQFISNPGLTGLLVLLSHLDCTWASIARLPMTLLGKPHSLEAVEMAGVRALLTIDQMQWTETNIADLVTPLIDFRAARPELIRRVCRSTLNAEGTSLAAETLLCKLLKRLNDDRANLEDRTLIVETLDDLRRRRPSRFEKL